MNNDDKVKTESIIFAAAMGEFLEKGYNGARMQAIADKAGINKALLHYYFKGKDDLYKSIFKKVFDDFFNLIIINTDQNLSFKEYLKAFIANYIDNLSQRQDLLKFLIWELENEAKSIGEYIRSLHNESSPAVGFPIFKKINEAKERGEIRELNTFHLIISIIGMCLYPFMAQSIIKNIWVEVDLNSESFRQQRKEEVFQLIWNGIQKGEANGD